MTEAVSYSSIVFILVSETYQQSSACKMELQFALGCRKKIVPSLIQKVYKFEMDGQLGFLLGNERYYEISNSDSIYQKLDVFMMKELAYLSPHLFFFSIAANDSN